MNSTELLNQFYGTTNPLEKVYYTIMNNKHLLPDKFIIHEDGIEIEDDERRKLILDGLLSVFTMKEEYEKCESVYEIQKLLNLE